MASKLVTYILDLELIKEYSRSVAFSGNGKSIIAADEDGENDVRELPD